MRTLAALLFIAATAAVAIALARMPTVADGRIVAADQLEEVRASGLAVVGLDCDPRIPIGRNGAVFTCTATLAGGATQIVDYMLRADGQIAPKPRAPSHAPRNPPPGDPSVDRP